MYAREYIHKCFPYVFFQIRYYLLDLGTNLPYLRIMHELLQVIIRIIVMVMGITGIFLGRIM